MQRVLAKGTPMLDRPVGALHGESNSSSTQGTTASKLSHLP